MLMKTRRNKSLFDEFQKVKIGFGISKYFSLTFSLLRGVCDFMVIELLCKRNTLQINF